MANWWTEVPKTNSHISLSFTLLTCIIRTDKFWDPPHPHHLIFIQDPWYTTKFWRKCVTINIHYFRNKQLSCVNWWKPIGEAYATTILMFVIIGISIFSQVVHTNKKVWELLPYNLADNQLNQRSTVDQSALSLPGVPEASAGDTELDPKPQESASYLLPSAGDPPVSLDVPDRPGLPGGWMGSQWDDWRPVCSFCQS